MGKNEPDADGHRGCIINTASVAAFDGQVWLFYPEKFFTSSLFVLVGKISAADLHYIVILFYKLIGHGCICCNF